MKIKAIKVFNYRNLYRLFGKEEEKTFTREEFIEEYGSDLFYTIEDVFYDDTTYRTGWENGVNYELFLEDETGDNMENKKGSEMELDKKEI